MKDFTRHKYKELLLALQAAGYTFQTMEEYVTSPAEGKVVVLRHDVDLHPNNSLLMAQLEQRMGAKATYYFRSVPESNRPDVIKSIARLGHEVGYHYEDMALAEGNVDEAYAHFEGMLAYFRTMYPVKTICMHGVPTSRYDGRDLWKKYDYHPLGIICEPYLDLDYSRLLYLTDTGRRWDGYKVSVRDKIPVYQDQWRKQGLTFHSTDQLIRALKDKQSPLNRLAPRILMTTHPQRWNDSMLWWYEEFFMQTLKNAIKRVLLLLGIR